MDPAENNQDPSRAPAEEEFMLVIRGRRLHAIHLAIQNVFVDVQRRAFARGQGERGRGGEGGHRGRRQGGDQGRGVESEKELEKEDLEEEAMEKEVKIEEMVEEEMK